MSTLSPYLTNPRRPWAKALLELQAGRRARRAFPPPGPDAEDGVDRHAASPIRILVADDDEDVRELVRAVLAERNFDVTVAADGSEALQLLSEQDTFSGLRAIGSRHSKDMFRIQHCPATTLYTPNRMCRQLHEFFRAGILITTWSINHLLP